MTIQTAFSPKPVSTKLSQPRPAAPTAPECRIQRVKTVPEEVIRLQAYRKWEACGKPIGDSLRFWLEAERELVQGK